MSLKVPGLLMASSQTVLSYPECLLVEGSFRSRAERARKGYISHSASLAYCDDVDRETKGSDRRYQKAEPDFQHHFPFSPICHFV
ncbi:hypothetical protein GGR50DRAFT_309475 [Xylaria sp. CBS 124048]|nr:hypothetical protein GGR50DRAFT_309475 [Xylaria sp. CBS 124048]